MSNMRDVIGLRVPYGKAASQYLTEFDPATGTVWAISIRRARPASAWAC